MAFDLNYFVPLSDMANSSVPRFFEYSDDTDSLATIITDDYFLSIKTVLNAGDIIKVFPAGSTVPIEVVVLSATSSTVTVEVIGGAETVAATKILDANDSGKTIYLAHATEFVTTLPLPVAGLNFKFVCKLAPSGASYTIVTAASANIIIGHVNEVTVDDTVDGDIATAADTITFTDGAAAVGDTIWVESDGTSWYVIGQCAIATGIALSAAS